MNIPFVLKFLNKIELFQVLQKLNKQFDNQVKTMGSIAPLWEAEKKILFWSYNNHKHLGSPLKLDSFRDKKSFLIKRISKYGNQGYKNTVEELKKRDSDKIQRDSNILKECFSDMDEGDYKMNIRDTKNIGRSIYKTGFNCKEINKLSIRKVFGNLVSRGYAFYYPSVTQEFDHWERETESISREITRDAVTTQYNCEGITISKEGLMMGELLNDLYVLESIDKSQKNKLIGLYREKTEAEYFLKKKFWKWIFYYFFISIGYLALIVIVLLVLKEFYFIIKDFLGLIL